MKKKISGNKIYIWCFCALLTILSLLLFLPETTVHREERELALQQLCLERLQKLAAICVHYAKCNNNVFPEDIMQTRSAAEELKSKGFLKEESLILCPSTRNTFPRTSYHFIPGIKLSMSKKMPCVIEKLTNHERKLGVIYVDGTVEQLEHNCRNYLELLPLFKGITPEEKRLLEIHLKRLDIP